MSKSFLEQDNTVLLSICCGSAAEGEIVDSIGRCDRCKEYSSFEEFEIMPLAA